MITSLLKSRRAESVKNAGSHTIVRVPLGLLSLNFCSLAKSLLVLCGGSSNG